MSIDNKGRRKFTINRCLVEEAGLYAISFLGKTQEYTAVLNVANISLVEGEIYIGNLTGCQNNITYIEKISHIERQVKLANILIERNKITSGLLRQIIRREVSNVIYFNKEAIDIIEDRVCQCKEANKHIVKNFRRWLENAIILYSLEGLIENEEINGILPIDTNLKENLSELLVGESMDKIFEVLFRTIQDIEGGTEYCIKLVVLYCYKKEIQMTKKLYMHLSKLVVQVEKLLKKKKMKFSITEISKSIVSNEELVFEAVDRNSVSVYTLKNWYLKKELHQRIREIQLKNCTIKNKLYSIGSGYDQEQREAIEYSLNSSLNIITGGAGTGKTYTVQEIIRCFRVQFPTAKIKIVAPTGKAMNCIKSRMEVIEAGTEIGTIHRVLGINVTGEQSKIKLDAELLIIDEASMVGIENFLRLLRTVVNNKNLHIVVVGDTNQIPPVDLGPVLPELLDIKDIHVITLTKIYRQVGNSAIIKNAYKIIEGNSELEWVAGEFELYEAKEGKILETVDMVIKSLIEEKVQIQQIQILSAINLGVNSVENINSKVQLLMTSYSENEFEVGTKVMNVINNYEKDVFNGETGVITKITESSSNTAITVSYRNDNSIKEILYINNEIKEIKQAFCTTIHKMQGSEEDIVVLVVSKKHLKNLDRRILYVAVTRAKERLIIIGSKNTLDEAIAKEIE